MIHLFALMSFVDMGTEKGPFAEKGCDAGAYATPFTQYARYVLKGNFTSTAATAYLTNGTSTLNLNSLPVGATVVAAYLFWTGQTNVLNQFANISFAGNPITGTVIAYDCSDCWGTSYNSLYACNVTAYITGNGSYVVSGFQSLGNSVPGVNGFTLIVVYCDANPATIRTVSIWTGDIDLQGCGPDDTSWVQSGFQATNPITDARAALTISECQDGYNSYARFNGNFVAYFNGTNPGNHYGHWEGNCAAWMTGGATQATWYVMRYAEGDSFPADCIAPVVSVISVTSTENETYNCVLEMEEGRPALPGKPQIVSIVPGGIILSGTPGSSAGITLYDPTGRSEGYSTIIFSRSGEGFIPAQTGVWFLVAERFGPIGKAVVW
ncbi:MAG: DUF3344 domain-containing protein [candidate division WOR-3 bacterium]